jgi:curved DNA-binding protein
MDQALFEDYYEDLQISPNADFETIERVYRLLAKRYHPDNHQTGKVEKFEIITKAYKVLSHPEKRTAYDIAYEKGKKTAWKMFSEKSYAEGFENDKLIRHHILSVLYAERRQNPSHSGVGLWRLEKLLKWPEKILEFHVWYLKEKSWIERTDSGGFAITAGGVDEVEKEGLIFGKHRLLPESTERASEKDNMKQVENQVGHIPPKQAPATE